MNSGVLSPTLFSLLSKFMEEIYTLDTISHGKTSIKNALTVKSFVYLAEAVQSPD